MGRNPFRLKQVSVRLKAERPLLSETPVKNPEDAARLVKELVSDFDREAVCIISLKNDLSPINFSICSIGSLNLALVEPRELIKTLCLSNATSFLMLHNHPGGSLSPSSQDVEITDRMSRLGSLLHIPMVDHVIVASDIVAAEGEEKTEEELVAKLATSGMEDEEPDEEETPSFCLS